MRPSCARTFRPKRAWGMPGAQCTRSLVCEVVEQNAHECSQRSHRKSPGIPARNGFNGFLRDLPGDRLFCHRRLQRLNCKLDASVEASGPHDFSVRDPSTPKASPGLVPVRRSSGEGGDQALSSEAPLASTASRPASVTMASAPQVGRDGGDMKVIWGFGKPEYFFGWDWTGRNSLIRQEKLDFRCKSAEIPPSSVTSPAQSSGSIPDFTKRRNNEYGQSLPGGFCPSRDRYRYAPPTAAKKQ